MSFIGSPNFPGVIARINSLSEMVDRIVTNNELKRDLLYTESDENSLPIFDTLELSRLGVSKSSLTAEADIRVIGVIGFCVTCEKPTSSTSFFEEYLPIRNRFACQFGKFGKDPFVFKCGLLISGLPFGFVIFEVSINHFKHITLVFRDC